MVDYSLPPMAVGLQVIAEAVDFNSHVTIVGRVSGKTYIDQAMSSIGQVITAVNLDARDFTELSIRVTVSNANTTTALIFILCAGAAHVSNSRSTLVWVTSLGIPISGQVDVSDRAARALGAVSAAAGATFDVSDRLARQAGRVVPVTDGNFAFIPDDQGGGVVALGVSLLNSRPPVWMVPNQLSKSIGQTIAAAATSVIVAGIAGQVIRLFDVSLAFDTTVATGAVQLEDTNANPLHQFSVGAIVSNPYNGRGLALASGAGVQIHNLMGANAAAIRGSIVFSQS